VTGKVKSDEGTLAPAAYIAARQREHPPLYQRADGGHALFQRALEFSPQIMQTRVANGLIAGGEVGALTPVAYVTDIGRGYAIEMHSGLMRLLYSAARAIMATDSGRYRDEVTPALSAPQAVRHIVDLFKHYKEQNIATAQAFTVTEAQKRWAHTIATHAETFLLMHELAHIYNEHSFWLWRPFRKKRDIHTLEIQADSTASRWLIDYLLNPRPGSSQRQMFFAGAEFGLRVRMAMETVGMRFAKTHPTAGDRIATLRATLRATANLRTFYAIASTSLAFDQMWRAIENMLLERAPVFDLTLEDVLASMGTLVAELLRDSDINDVITVRQVAGEPGRMQCVLAPKEPQKIAMVTSARDYMARVDPDRRNAARAHAGDVFEPGTAAFSVLLALLNTAQP
jgi:Peptidase U49